MHTKNGATSRSIIMCIHNTGLCIFVFKYITSFAQKDWVLAFFCPSYLSLKHVACVSTVFIICGSTLLKCNFPSPADVCHWKSWKLRHRRGWVDLLHSSECLIDFCFAFWKNKVSTFNISLTISFLCLCTWHIMLAIKLFS